MSDWYVAVIERPDGSTYEQRYKYFEDLIHLYYALGSGYRICEVY